jgi:hypothetical protein
MKLLTTIKPRRDGTVSVVGEDGQKYVFQPDAEMGGALTCEVTDQSTVARLLVLGDFEPADPDDVDDALSIYAKARQSIAQGATGTADTDDEDDFTETPNGGLPVEAETPPAPRKPRKNRAE